MVKCVHTLSLREIIVNILLHIKTIHEDEGRRLVLLEQLLLERVTVLSIVDNDFAIGSADKPFVVWFQETDIKAVQCCVHTCQILDGDS